MQVNVQEAADAHFVIRLNLEHASIDCNFHYNSVSPCF